MKGDGGANYWKVVTPERFADSSGGAELVAVTIALKTTLGVNMLLTDLRRVGVPATPTRPVVFLLGATAVTDDSHERLTKQTRWMAARKAMIRYALTSGALALRKIPSEDTSPTSSPSPSRVPTSTGTAPPSSASPTSIKAPSTSCPPAFAPRSPQGSWAFSIGRAPLAPPCDAPRGLAAKN